MGSVRELRELYPHTKSFVNCGFHVILGLRVSHKSSAIYVGGERVNLHSIYKSLHFQFSFEHFKTMNCAHWGLGKFSILCFLAI